MPVSFPMAPAAFLDLLPTASVPFTLPAQVEVSRTAGGDVLTANIGSRLWQGEIRLARLTPFEAHEAEVLIALVEASGGSFLAYRKSQPGPRLDPFGTVLGAASPRLLDLPAGDARLLSLDGLPAGYTLTRGDFLAFEYGSNPIRRALHRVVDASVVADGSGETPLFQVQPNRQPGAAPTTLVSLIKPACKAIIEPGSVNAGRSTKFITEGMSFRFIQTLR